MKRLRYVVPALLAALTVSCGNALNDAMGDPMDPSITVSNAPYKHLEYLYNDQFAKKAYEIATSGIQTRSSQGASETFEADVKMRVNMMLDSPVLYAANPSKATPDKMWYEKCDMTADQMQAFMGSAEGKAALEKELNSALHGSSKKEPKKVIVVGAAIVGVMLSALHTYNDYVEKNDIIDAFNQVCEYLNIISDQITALDGKVDTLTNIVWDADIYLKESKLNDAISDINGFVKDIVAYNNVDNATRLDMIKTFINNGYEARYDRAFQSAVDRTSALKGKYSADPNLDTKIPFNMLFKDIIFLQYVSNLRLDLMSSLYSGQELITLRGKYASLDLKRVRAIKESIWGAFQNVAAGSDKEKQCVDAYAFVVAWEITLLAHMEAAKIADSVVLVEDANADHSDYGFGSFGLLGSYGHVLRRSDTTLLVPITDIANGTSLSSVFDANDSGSMDSGKYFRISVNGKNIASYGLTPVVHNFTVKNESPEKNLVFVDPLNGTFTLPKPGLWCRFEGNTTPTTGSFASADAMVYRNDSGKFGYGAGSVQSTASDVDGNSSTIEKAIQLNSGAVVGNKGTISLMIRLSSNGAISYDYEHGSYAGHFDVTGTRQPSGNMYALPTYTLSAKSSVSVFGNDNTLRFEAYTGTNGQTVGTSGPPNGSGQFQYTLNVAASQPIRDTKVRGVLYIGGSASPVVVMGNTGTWIHLYIVWDKSGGLAGGKTMQVYANGTPVISITSSFTMPSDLLVKYKSVCSAQGSLIYEIYDGGQYTKQYQHSTASTDMTIDNLKVWNHMVSEDPTWINALASQEDAMHPVYGAANNYKANTVKVTYYKDLIVEP
jgi:hypothetical protein